MRKVFFITLLAAVSFSANAQDYQKSLGLRLGRPLGLSYKQFLSSSNAIEIIADLDIFEKNVTKISGSGFYLWQKSLGDVSGLSWFVGPGASAGIFMVSVAGNSSSDFNASLNGLIGLDYKLATVPLVIAVDFGPRFYLMHSAGFLWGGAITLRYTL